MISTSMLFELCPEISSDPSLRLGTIGMGTALPPWWETTHHETTHP